MASLTIGPTSPLSNRRIPTRGSWVHFYAGILASVLGTAAAGLQAASLDTLLIVDVNGQPLQLQHTIVSDGELIVFELPADARFPEAYFVGPERQTFTHAWDENPTRIALWSGSAILRHALAKHPTPEDPEPLRTELTLPGYPAGFNVEDGELAQWQITLVFPSTLRPVDWSPIEASGTWTRSGNSLRWQQSHARRTPLRVSLEYANDPIAEEADPCGGDDATLEACAPDADADGVPDHRDLCLGPAPTSALTPAPANSNALTRAADQDEFGCAPSRPLRLDGVAFQAGQSYLDIGSRRILDRLAAALLHFGERQYQVGAHTDSEGSNSYNRSLSKRRAESVRRYLMLRGITPDRLQAAGYGEEYPRRRNDSLEGRRANRRVELKRLD